MRYNASKGTKMSIMKFDTLSTVKELQSGGFEQLQAETLVKAISKITTANSEDLATKGDISALRSEIKEIDAKIDKVETSLDAKIDKVEAVLSAKLDILKWIGGVIAVAAVTAAARYVFFSA
jgi:hypothetical protein